MLQPLLGLAELIGTPISEPLKIGDRDIKHRSKICKVMEYRYTPRTSHHPRWRGRNSKRNIAELDLGSAPTKDTLEEFSKLTVRVERWMFICAQYFPSYRFRLTCLPRERVGIRERLACFGEVRCRPFRSQQSVREPEKERVHVRSRKARIGRNETATVLVVRAVSPSAKRGRAACGVMLRV